MKTRHIVFAALMLLAAQSQAQYLDRAWISTNAYEDMSDLMRRMPGMYPLDYGVAGAPVLFRPWGFAPWYLGVERDGIPWSRVSDGLYDSNLDLPDELDTLALRHDGTHPFATMQLKTRALPTDTATTEVTLQEGYYGFGRVDFTHAQRLNKRIEAEGRGRLWWYDGMRQLPGGNTFSRARFYNLSGKFRYDLGRSWRTKLEYGGANVDAQSPTLVDSLVRPQDYSEREYGTLQIGRYDSIGHVELGLHARQDRVTRDEYYRLREQFWYGYVEGGLTRGRSYMKSRIATESSEFNYTGLKGHSDKIVSSFYGGYDAKVAELGARAMLSKQLSGKLDGDDGKNALSVAGNAKSREFSGTRLEVEAFGGEMQMPGFWRYSQFEVSHLGLTIDDEFLPGRYFAGQYVGFEAPRDYRIGIGGWSGGLAFAKSSSSAEIKWNAYSVVGPRYLLEGDTIHTYGRPDGREEQWQGPSLVANIALLDFLRVQSTSCVSLDKNGLRRALDTRSYSRLLFTKDYFKAPLRITSYVAYEHIGKHRAVSDIREEVIGPAHLVHFRVEAGIHGVTMVWGLENLTGQHYEYLPGYMLIRKEEYFGVKWTLKL